MSRFDAFWAGAKTLSLSEEKRALGRARLKVHMDDAAVRKEASDGLLSDMEQSPFWQSAKTPLLAPDRKAFIREQVRAYVEPDESPAVERQSFLSRVSWKWKMLVASVTTLFSFGSMGLCYAAEAAVPGDVLYPVKIHVNETVLSAFALSPEAQAAWEVRLAERRLREEQLLIARGVSGPLLEELHVEVAERAQIAQEHLSELTGEYPELEERLSVVIAVYGGIRERIQERLEGDPSVTPTPRERMEERRDRRRNRLRL